MITNAAMIPPTSLPFPPDVEIPPKTAIAIASISNPLPVFVFAPYSTDAVSYTHLDLYKRQDLLILRP